MPKQSADSALPPLQNKRNYTSVLPSDPSELHPLPLQMLLLFFLPFLFRPAFPSLAFRAPPPVSQAPLQSLLQYPLYFQEPPFSHLHLRLRPLSLLFPAQPEILPQLPQSAALLLPVQPQLLLQPLVSLLALLLLQLLSQSVLPLLVQPQPLLQLVVQLLVQPQLFSQPVQPLFPAQLQRLPPHVILLLSLAVLLLQPFCPELLRLPLLSVQDSWTAEYHQYCFF